MKTYLDRLAYLTTEWVGSPTSLLIHTLFFGGSLWVPYAPLAERLLLLTTVVSLEAIYMGILIQMTVNKHGKRLEGVEADIEEIQEDVEDIGEGFEKVTIIRKKK